MTIEIAGLGCALPTGWLTQADAASAANRLRLFPDDAAAARQLQLLNALYRRSGVEARHSVLLRSGEEHPVDRQTFYQSATHAEDRGPSTAARMERYESEAPALAEQACRPALAAAGCQAAEITHLVTVSCSGFNSPGFDLALYPRLGLSPETARTHVGFMGCHGALNGLRVARALAASDPQAVVLLCAVELCTLHHQYTDQPQQIVANSLFADGAAAAVVRVARGTNGRAAADSVHAQEPRPSNGAPEGSRSRLRSWQIIDSGSYVVPDSEEMMSWRIGDHGFCMTLSAQVPELIKTQLRPWLSAWLARHGLETEAIATWAVHPGGPRILSATASALGLPQDALAASAAVLAMRGNMSSPTILFILESLAAERAAGPCVALAFGPGLVVEAALLR
jgi:predicted naringenin-chalcone synthase